MASLLPEKTKTLAEKQKLLDSVADKVNKKYGKHIMGRIGKDKEILKRLTISYIPTPCRDLNIAISGSSEGGFPRRRCTLIAGMPDSGKTSLVLESIGLAMKNDPNFTAGWLESENSLTKEYICDTFGVDPDRFFFIPLDPGVGAESTLDMVQGVVGTGALDLFCINSLKCLVPQREMDAALSDSTVAEQARMNAKLTKKFTAMVAQHETAFILITHLTTMIGSMSRDQIAA